MVYLPVANFIFILTVLFENVYNLFQLKVPGFEFTYFDVLIGTSIGMISLALLKGLLNRSGSTSLGRTSRNPKISDERKNDTK